MHKEAVSVTKFWHLVEGAEAGIQWVRSLGLSSEEN